MKCVEVALARTRVTIRIERSTLNFSRANKLMAETKNNRSKTRAMATRDPGTAKLRNDQALLMVTASEGDANMLYAVGFFVPDPFIYFQHKNQVSSS